MRSHGRTFFRVIWRKKFFRRNSRKKILQLLLFSTAKESFFVTFCERSSSAWRVRRFFHSSKLWFLSKDSFILSHNCWVLGAHSNSICFNVFFLSFMRLSRLVSFFLLVSVQAWWLVMKVTKITMKRLRDNTKWIGNNI